MINIKNYKGLLSNNRCLKLFVKPFKSDDMKEKLDVIFNSQTSKLDWSNIPVHVVVK